MQPNLSLCIYSQRIKIDFISNRINLRERDIYGEFVRFHGCFRRLWKRGVRRESIPQASSLRLLGQVWTWNPYVNKIMFYIFFCKVYYEQFDKLEAIHFVLGSPENAVMKKKVRFAADVVEPSGNNKEYRRRHSSKAKFNRELKMAANIWSFLYIISQYVNYSLGFEI